MIDDSALIAQKIAYIDRLRALHKAKRTIGFIGCLVGVLMMLAGRFSPHAPKWSLWAGVAIIAGSWLVFAFVIVSRMAYVRTHPFDAEHS